MACLPAPLAENWGWQQDAVCRGMPSSIFFAPRGLRGQTLHFLEQDAKAICSGCPVMQECRRYALSTPEPYGVWGGMTPTERHAVMVRGRPD
ncbi:WhiB family transcriptional regulator [Rhodococcus fascians]|nr:WhiB family transcriptional regulator [Rhodococcus fascians]MBY4140889.1 WhiB family transcriptional regulator [Rhodococcus fascians]MBY4219553.1 WhiB family transcriptional regulator [Rhodococcus fascians]MBY4221862.1 WhiB family transcriptional regulator [Rhodococcus fascians]MBY4233863.1 WhiB family transcriptional regulator [Rhodococcus fascians]